MLATLERDVGWRSACDTDSVSDPDDDDAPGNDATHEDVVTGAGATLREGPGVRRSPSGEPAGGERLARGTLIGRYVVVDVLGAGGMGVVYSAYDPELDRKLAIKLLQARHGVGSESGGQAWLLREAQAMARLAHPNVVAVYDVGAIPGERVFVAMELVEGETLRAWLRTPRTWRQVLQVMRAAGAGLAAAHAVGLVHRDFKPDNVLVGNDGRVRVMDFGLARMSGGDPDRSARTSDVDLEVKSPLSERLTMTGAMLGTPAYMAPEIYRGHSADVLADEFAFGVALYEALYRGRPFRRADLVDGVASAPKPPASADVPAWLERIVLRAIALERTQRFASMNELLVALAADPTTKRRRTLVAAVALVVAGGAVASAYALGGGAPAPCTDAATRLAGVWDQPAHRSLETAFGKITKPFVADITRGTEHTLDTYAAGWVEMRTETCRATRVDGSQSDDVLQVRMACLDARLVELQTLAALFATADEPLVRDAVNAAQKLSRLTDCADVAALLAPDPLPKDPIVRAQVTTMQGKLAEARANYKASRLENTLARVTAIAPQVMQLGHLPTEASMHLLIGQTLWILKGPSEGEPELRKAVLAAEAGKADEIKVEALVQLANLATGTGRFDVASERLQQASATLTRLGTNWPFRVRALDSEALLDLRQSQHAKAIEIAHQAVEMAAKHPDADYPYALMIEATILNAASHSKDALAELQKALVYQDALGHRRIDVASTLQMMASAELGIGKIDDAIPHLQDALSIYEAIYGADNAAIAEVLNALSAAQGMKGKLEDALATAQRALAILAKVPDRSDETYASVQTQIADLLVHLGRPKEAIQYFDDVLAARTARLGPKHIQTLITTLMKCDALAAAHDLAQAVATCRSALAGAEQAFGAANALLFLFLSHTAMVLQDSKQTREASTLYERAIKIGANDPLDLYDAQLRAARARWDLGDHTGAVALARKARDGFASLGDRTGTQAKEADAWLAQHQDHATP
jgi:eukaryotic-like serine/threonine-protein kinase